MGPQQHLGSAWSCSRLALPGRRRHWPAIRPCWARCPCDGFAEIGPPATVGPDCHYRVVGGRNAHRIGAIRFEGRSNRRNGLRNSRCDVANVSYPDRTRVDSSYDAENRADTTERQSLGL